MNEEINFNINDTYRNIGRIIDDLRSFESPLCDGRIKAILITDLEKTQMMSLKLIKNDDKAI